MTGIRRTAGRFLGREDGNFAVVMAFGLSMIAMAVGFGVNVVQSYQVKMSLRDALDAAITSTARDLTTGIIAEAGARPSVLAFLDANGDTRFITKGSFTLESLVIDKAAKTVEGTASATVDLLFPLFSVKAPKVSVTSAALYSDKLVEIAMMLDVTGSMAEDRRQKTDKIGDLRRAARNAVELAMAQNRDPRNPRVRVALVPYASGVNVGGLDRYLYAEGSSSSDVPPVEGDALLRQKTGRNTLPPFSDYLKIVGQAFPRPDACATERKAANGKPDMTADGPGDRRKDRSGKWYYALVNRDDHLSGSGMNRCPDAQIIPLTADSDRLLDSISRFEANGYTAGAIAIQWTYYMLSSSWSQAIGDAGLGDGPAAANKRKISKVAILMTDGQFNTAFADARGSNYNSQGSRSRATAESLCDNMKSDGIEIFTIGFDLNNKGMSATERDQAKAVLKDCSSPDGKSARHYFEASTGEELDAAFREIIGNTERLALIK